MHSGRSKKLFELMAERAECEDARRLMIDSTFVRAHQHAARAARKGGGGEAQALDAVGGVTEVLGDKAMDSDAVRGVVQDDLDALPVITSLSNRKEPWPRDDKIREIYKQRNRVERAFAKAKQFRRFAKRYEKLMDVYLAVALIVFGFIHVRKLGR